MRTSFGGSQLGADFTVSLGGTVFDFAGSDYVVIPGVITSVSLLIIVSLLTKPSEPEKWAPFFEEAEDHPA